MQTIGLGLRQKAFRDFLPREEGRDPTSVPSAADAVAAVGTGTARTMPGKD
jgi:hypothetical protein